MTTISGTGSATSWPDSISNDSRSKRAGGRADKMFATVDSDGSGSVDTTELQTLLDKVAQKTGATLGSASDVMGQLDSDGDGSLGKDELSSGMKDLMPPPSSTLDFAQRSGGGGPPTSDSAGAGGSSRSGSTSTDPLDTNGDGVVSAEEAAAGAMQDLISAADSDGDHRISKSEFDTFEKNLAAAVAGDSSATSASASSNASDSASTSDDDANAAALTALIDKVLKQYSQNAASGAAADAENALSISA